MLTRLQQIEDFPSIIGCELIRSFKKLSLQDLLWGKEYFAAGGTVFAL